jgi:iron complex transport system substrate-binding protein
MISKEPAGSRRSKGVTAVLAAAVVVAATASPAAPRRVLSLNPCLDGILLQVADRGQIVALSHYSREPSQSVIAAEARRYPFTWGSAEEVVARRPDLVLTSGMGAMQLSGVLPRLHIRQESFTVPNTVAESLAQVRRVAVLVGHPDRGEALAARIQAALAAAEPRPGEPRLGALVFEYHGLASGPGTLVDELMRRTGFDNLAPRYGLRRTGDVPLDVLVSNPPQVLLAGRLAPGEPVWADRILSHPVLRSLGPRVRRESFPEQLMFCGGPSIIPAAAALARAREHALRGLSE